MTMSIPIEFEINDIIITRAVRSFLEEYGYDIDEIKINYLNYVLYEALENNRDDVREYVEERMSPEEKERILFAFADKFEEMFHKDVENALAKDC